ncbi:MAG: alpha/beta fold hydrolase [Bdellovibrionales bacterium]|nr:alpha/beta fold hydrolase [Bdellovibrionales bacterium]
MPVKIIIIHGLNNNLECFYPFRDQIRSLGFEAELMCLPGHGQDREEARDFEVALTHFDENIQKLITGPYAVIAFSQGALYFQLWLEKYNRPLPLAQVLLAPALFIRHFSKLSMIMGRLPAFMIIISQMPRKLRRYHYLNIWEYRTLFNKARKFQEFKTPLKAPTLILIDPKDELVDAQKLKHELDGRTSGAEIEFWERKYLRGRRPGKYHVLFHPEYFTPDDWQKFTSKISEFVKKASSGV